MLVDGTTPKKPRIGSVLPNGAELKRLRDEKGWTQADLESESGVSRGSIWKMEQGIPVSRRTLGLIADALGVSPCKIVHGYYPGERGGPPDRERVDVAVELARAFDEFDEEAEIPHVLTTIRKVLGSKSTIYIIAFTPGSVRLYLNMTKHDAEKLAAEFQRGRLSSLKATGVSILGPDGEILTSAALPDLRRIRPTWFITVGDYLRRAVATVAWFVSPWARHRVLEEKLDAQARILEDVLTELRHLSETALRVAPGSESEIPPSVADALGEQFESVVKLLMRQAELQMRMELHLDELERERHGRKEFEAIIEKSVHSAILELQKWLEDHKQGDQGESA